MSSVRFTKAEVAAHFPDYKESGDEMRVKECPHCHTSKYKFYVNPYKGACNCKHCNYSPPLEILIGESKYVSVFEKKETPQEDDIEPLPDCYDLMNVPMMHPAHKYYTSRGFTGDLLESYGAKYCETGVNTRRLVFPLYSSTGEYKGFQGRYIRDNLPKEIPKWRNAKGIKKSEVVYNFNRVLGRQNWCLLVEGIFDTLRFPDWAVCVFGKNPSEYQKKLLDYFEYIILGLDADAHRQEEELRHSVVENGYNRVASLKLNKDPDEHTEEEMASIILQKVPERFDLRMV